MTSRRTNPPSAGVKRPAEKAAPETKGAKLKAGASHNVAGPAGSCRPRTASGIDNASFFDLFHEFGILKKVPRTGWTWRGVPDCESIADHCFRVNLIAMFLCDALNRVRHGARNKFSPEKVLRMAALHEIAECRVGDIPYPAQKYIGPKVKTAAEKAAVRDMLSALGGLSPDYAALWEEFEDGASPEGKLVKAADKIEMLIQAIEYEKAGVRTLSDFWENGATLEQIGFCPELRGFAEYLFEYRNGSN